LSWQAGNQDFCIVYLAVVTMYTKFFKCKDVTENDHM